MAAKSITKSTHNQAKKRTSVTKKGTQSAVKASSKPGATKPAKGGAGAKPKKAKPAAPSPKVSKPSAPPKPKPLAAKKAGTLTSGKSIAKPVAVPPSPPGKAKLTDAKPGKPIVVKTEPARVTKPEAAKLIAKPVVSKPPVKRVSVRPLPPVPAPRVPTVEERTTRVRERLLRSESQFQLDYQTRFDMSWIYHDSALEGVVYTEDELEVAFNLNSAPSTETSSENIINEIRRHRAALDFIRNPETKDEITVDFIRGLHLMLHPQDGDVKNVKYRKDIPQHRLYFHEYAPPEKIPAKVSAVVDFVQSPENRKSRSLVRFASRAHFDLLRAFPFASDSGKVARLLMNLILIRGGLPPAIVHMSERQRYYEALKGGSAVMTTIVADAIDNNLKSVERLLDMRDLRAGTKA
jgi:Fic/DOC family